MHAGCVYVAGIHLSGHICQNLLSPCDGMCTQTRPQFILSSKEFWGLESETMSNPREKSPLPEAQRRVKPVMLHHADSEPNTLPTAILAPPNSSRD